MWNSGAMDGFYRESEIQNPATASNALGFYEPEDLPFYSWLYGAFASSDRFFCSVLGPTAPNRKYLMTATSNGLRDKGDPLVGAQRSIFDALDAAGTAYRMYNPETYDVPSAPPSVVRDLPAFFADLAGGTLPKISFVNALFESSEHPPLDSIAGEKLVHDVVVALATSPAWATTALVITYDEAGGFFDHVPPPSACPPDALPANAAFDRLGFRVPFVIVSAWARRAFVSHRDHSHTSITRLVELLAGVPALTNRDANSDALLDLFDFASAPSPPPDVSSIPNAGTSTCAIVPDAGPTDAATDGASLDAASD
jgi:phospholipase C